MIKERITKAKESQSLPQGSCKRAKKTKKQRLPRAYLGSAVQPEENLELDKRDQDEVMEQFEAELKILQQMGFKDTEKLLVLLQKYQGNLQTIINHIFAQ